MDADTPKIPWHLACGNELICGRKLVGNNFTQKIWVFIEMIYDPSHYTCCSDCHKHIKQHLSEPW